MYIFIDFKSPSRPSTFWFVAPFKPRLIKNEVKKKEEKCYKLCWLRIRESIPLSRSVKSLGKFSLMHVPLPVPVEYVMTRLREKNHLRHTLVTLRGTSPRGAASQFRSATISIILAFWHHYLDNAFRVVDFCISRLDNESILLCF